MPLNILPLLEKNVMVTTTYFSDYTTATNNNSNTKNKNKKLALTVSLAAIIVISSSLSFLVQITTLKGADAITDPDSTIEFNLVGGGGVIVSPKDVPVNGPPTFNPMFSECKQGKLLLTPDELKCRKKSIIQMGGSKICNYSEHG